MGAIALAFLAGHCFVQLWPRLPALHWASSSCPSSWLRLRARQRRFQLAAGLLAESCGRGRTQRSAWRPTCPPLEGQDLLLRGYVASLPDSNADPQFVLHVVEGPPGSPSHGFASWYRALTCRSRPATVALMVRLKRRNGFANPGGFDYEGHLFREGIGATGYVRDEERNVLLCFAVAAYAVTRAPGSPPRFAKRCATRKCSAFCRARGRRYAGDDAGAMARVRGDRHDPPDGDLRFAHRHGCSAGPRGSVASSYGCGPLRQALECHARASHRWHPAALVYSMLAGLSVPTQRTLLMLVIYFAGRWYRRQLGRRKRSVWRSSAFLLIDPFAPLAPGAWLSFGAVAILLVASGTCAGATDRSLHSRVQIASRSGSCRCCSAFGSVSLVSPSRMSSPFRCSRWCSSNRAPQRVAGFGMVAGRRMAARARRTSCNHVAVLQWLAQCPLALWHFHRRPPPRSSRWPSAAVLLVAPGIWPTRRAGVLLAMPVALHRAPAGCR